MSRTVIEHIAEAQEAHELAHGRDCGVRVGHRGRDVCAALQRLWATTFPRQSAARSTARYRARHPERVVARRESTRDQQAEYRRIYREDGRTAAYHKEYYRRNRDKALAYQRQWDELHPGVAAERSRQWRRAHSAKVAA